MNKTLPILEVTPSMYRDFSCGYAQLDEYLKRFAKTNHKKNIGKTFVLIFDDVVAGYYTVSMGEIEFSTLSDELRSSLPKYPIPVARIGRLAVHSAFQGKGFGKYLLVDALKRIVEASQTVAAFAVVVDAKDNKSKAFYTNFGFIAYKDEPLSLFLPLATFKTEF